MSGEQNRNIAIFFGSQTGNAEELAQDTSKLAAKHNLEATVHDMEGFNAADFSKHQRILIITSTWGDGEMPDNSEDVWTAVCEQNPSLSGVNYSVCAIGDTSYDEYCKAGLDWDEKFESLGGTRVHPIQLCDVDFEPEWKTWVESVLPVMSQLELSVPETVVEESVNETSDVPEVAVETAPVSSSTKSIWTNKNPYQTQITENYILNGEGSRKETRHIVFALGDSGLDYKVGDALGVIAENPPHIVEELIEVQGWDRNHAVTTHNGERDLYTALKKDFEVHLANKKFVQSLAGKVVSKGLKISVKIIARNRSDSEWTASESSPNPPGLPGAQGKNDPVERVEALVGDAKAIEDYLWTRDYVDIMREFSVKYSPEEFLELADRLKPRLYSIASSHDAHPGYVELTVGIVRFEYNDRPRGGLCTQYMADEIDMTGKDIGVFMSPTKSFILPEDKDTDIIMVGPGTGIAPFRAFMEQRVFDGGKGRNWLFFGDQSAKTEFYYKETIEDWLDNGSLYRFTTAWSRDQKEKIYVQHRLIEHGAEIWQWFENGAYFYICGDKTYMAKDVHRALIDIAMEHGGMSEEDATHFIGTTMMREEKRYLRDVY
tara:strand:+ start:77917 stop:79722 length:1806 start_codon:yes stop_codon:yes gene_type:complete